MLNEAKVVEIIDQSVMSVLENMAFMEVCRIEEAPYSTSILDYWAKVGLLSPLKGEVVLACASPLLSEIADTVFAGEAAGEAALMDVVAELTNTIAGNLLSKLFPSDESIRVAVPEKGRRGGLSGVHELYYQLDDGQYFCVGYHIEGMRLEGL